MAEKKQKKVRYITPKGVAEWPRLNSPDFGNAEFPTPDGVYKVDLRMSMADAQPMIDKLQPQLDAWVEKVKDERKKDPKNKGKKLDALKVNPLYRECVDDDGNDTGEIVMRFKMKASGKKKDGSPWAMRPDLFDAKGREFDVEKLIYGGSILKVAFTVQEYYKAASGAGLSLRLEGAQVIKLVSNTRNAGTYGFGDESDDDDADSSTDNTSDDEGDGDEGGGEDGDF
jgi:hypothetical protein